MNKSHRIFSNKNINRLINLCIMLWMVVIAACESDDESNPLSVGDAEFINFSATTQTLPPAIRKNERKIVIELAHDADITKTVPEFEVPERHQVFINDVLQVSGETTVDLTHSVNYEIRSGNSRTSWEVSAVPLKCKILVDASHDGGVWWYPQSEATGFDVNAWHQGMAFADVLREKGFEVTELPRGITLTDEMFFGHYIVIRACGFQSYSASELKVYERLLDRGMNLVLFSDHKKNDPVDELEGMLGLEFRGAASGMVTTFGEHAITSGLSPFEYAVGSVLTNAEEHDNIEVLGWLGSEDFGDLNFNNLRDDNEPVSPAVMGILRTGNSRVFFMGDQNSFQFQPQPFVDNLIGWMGTCFQP